MAIEAADNPRWGPWLLVNGIFVGGIYLGFVVDLPGVGLFVQAIGWILLVLGIMAAGAIHAYHKILMHQPTRGDLARAWLVVKTRSVAEKYPMLDRAYDLGLLVWAAALGATGLFILVLAMALSSEVIRKVRADLRGTLNDLLDGGKADGNTDT